MTGWLSHLWDKVFSGSAGSFEVRNVALPLQIYGIKIAARLTAFQLPVPKKNKEVRLCSLKPIVTAGIQL